MRKTADSRLNFWPCFESKFGVLVNNNLNNASFIKSTDEELIRAFSVDSNQQLVFLEIVRRYKERIYYHVRRILVDHDDADDACQNAFIKVWENLSKFRSDCALFSWIYRIATNEALTVLRKKRPNIGIDEAYAELNHLVDNGPGIDGDEIARRLQKVLITLPEKQRLVFNLKYFDELTYEQMSEVTGTSVGALKASYFHAVKKIEQQLNIEN